MNWTLGSLFGYFGNCAVQRDMYIFDNGYKFYWFTKMALLLFHSLFHYLHNDYIKPANHHIIGGYKVNANIWYYFYHAINSVDFWVRKSLHHKLGPNICNLNLYSFIPFFRIEEISLISYNTKIKFKTILSTLQIPIINKTQTSM